MGRDYEAYFKVMSRAVHEKARFIREDLNKSPLEGPEITVVDFGCGDGSLIRSLNHDFHDIKFIGIEKDEVLATLNKTDLYSGGRQVEYLTLDDFFESSYYHKPYRIIFSSVLHEIFSFELDPLEMFQKLIENAQVVYIRDMFFTDSNLSFEIKDNTKINQVHENCKEKLRIPWDKINYNAIYAEYLMKVRYKENWELEVQEAYFSVPFKDIILTMDNNGKTLLHYNPHMNEWLLNKIKEETSYDLKKFTMTTHIELIFANK
jgi:hypothetical protein